MMSKVIFSETKQDLLSTMRKVMFTYVKLVMNGKKTMYRGDAAIAKHKYLVHETRD